NEDYETKTDELTRKKGELEAEITKKSELEKKHKNKAKLLDEEQCENNKLVEKITSLEAKEKELNRTNLEESQTVNELSTKLRN
ncbi:14582_t:CDS:2, partial [Funneliformis geosporum]